MPRSPTMAFSSVRENVTPNTQLELCWKMLLFIIFCINSILNLFYSFISCIDFPFIFIFISLVLCLIPFYQQMLLLYILLYFIQQMLLLFVLLVVDDKPIIVYSVLFYYDQQMLLLLILLVLDGIPFVVVNLTHRMWSITPRPHIMA